MDKKGAGTFMTWFFGYPLVFFLLLAFAIVVFLLASQKVVSGGFNEINLERSDPVVLSVHGDLQSFLESEVELEGERISVRNLILIGDLERGSRSEVFNKAAGEFLEKRYPFAAGSNPRWIRVYESDEDPVKEGRVSGIAAYQNEFGAGGVNCDPALRDRSLVAEYLIRDKKLVFCVEKRYFENE